MTLIKTSYNRRSFLKVSGAVGGGLLLGFNFLAGCTPKEIEEKIAELEMPENWYGMNGFIKIGENGVVTIMSPNPEIGQNVKTSMPMLVAEELDVNWQKVVVEQAGLDTENFSRQLAGGSHSIRLGWKSLRTAGATARRMLLEAAATKLEVPVEELTTNAGVITHEASEQSLGYGEVAADAVGLEVPEEIELKDPKDFKIIGQSILNVDGRDIVKGTPLFGMDYEEEGMLIAMIVHPPSFGMKVKTYNKDEVKALDGIVDVLELDTDYFDEMPFARNAFLKNSMVAVVGNTTWEVMKARRALKVEWERTSKAENSSDHEAKLTALLEKSTEPARKDGDPEAAFKNATKVIERTYSAPFLPHNTMAPMNFFAHVTDTEAKLVGPIQTPQMTASILANVLELPEENISIMMTRMGGGFGRRLYGNFAFEAALISKMTQKPIKVIYSREDDIGNGTYRPAYKVKYKAAIDENNNLTALTVKGAGAHGGPVWADRFPAGTVENYSAEDSSMETNISTGAWRAPKSNFIAGAEQSFLDEVAEALGKDPIDFRIELFEKAKNNPVGEENDYDPERYAGVLKLVKEKSGWGQEMEGVHRGVAAYYCHRTYVAQVVDMVKKDDKLVIQKVWCAVDCGIVVNPTGAKNQIEGGTVDGIGTAMYGGLTFKDGVPEQTNFGAYQMIRHTDAPLEIETFFVDNGIDPTGLGEPGLPPIMGALANALYKATGTRYYDQPFSKQSDVLG
ncbi:MAG: molybdopterin cofactor-binding domain-containing protein [Bacteroidota bacterium]